MVAIYVRVDRRKSKRVMDVLVPRMKIILILGVRMIEWLHGVTHVAC